MSLKQMQILDGAVAVKPEPVGVVGTDLGGTHLMYGSQYVGKTPDKKTAIFFKDVPIGAPLYTTPPQRKPLSNQKIIEMYNEPRSDAEMIEFARAIEAAHGIWPENSDCHGPDWTDRDGEYLK